MDTYQPLTAEQFNKAKMAGFTPDQIIQHEQTRKSQMTSSQPSVIQSIPGIKQATDFGVGIGSEIGKAGLGLGKAFVKLSSPVAKLMGAGAENQQLQDTIDKISNNIYQKPFQNESNSISGKTGQIVGKVVPYLGGLGEFNANLANKATGLVGNGTGFIPSAGRVLAGAGAEGLANAGEAYGLSGGNGKEAAVQGLTAGLLKGTTGAISEIGNKFNVPEKLMNKIYKTDKNEQDAIFHGKITDPLSKQVVDRGIKGSIPEQADQLINGAKDAETKIMDSFKASGNPTIVLNNPKRYIDLVQNQVKLLRKQGADAAAQGLESSLGSIDSTTGEISANNALGLRRFIDGMTYLNKTFTQTPHVAASKAGLEEMGNALRSQINSIGGTGQAMKDYQFYMAAMDKLSRYAANSKNADALGLMNSFLLGDAFAGGNPALALGVAGKKIMSIPSVRSGAAQTIKNFGTSSTNGAVTRSVFGNLLSKNIQNQ